MALLLLGEHNVAGLEMNELKPMCVQYQWKTKKGRYYKINQIFMTNLVLYLWEFHILCIEAQVSTHLSGISSNCSKIVLLFLPVE